MEEYIVTFERRQQGEAKPEFQKIKEQNVFLSELISNMYSLDWLVIEVKKV